MTTIVGQRKTCAGCKESLPVELFTHRRSRCLPCQRLRAKETRRRNTCADCGLPASERSLRCRPCAGALRRLPPGPDRRVINAQGYVLLKGYHEHPNANRRDGCILEHVKVMGDLVGRPLVSGENVHHKNGVRDDNRPENLELWFVGQPKGQRAEDLVVWAKEILARYDQTVTPDFA